MSPAFLSVFRNLTIPQALFLLGWMALLAYLVHTGHVDALGALAGVLANASTFFARSPLTPPPEEGKNEADKEGQPK